MFPKDAKTIFFSVPNSGGSTCGTLLPASSVKRTILQGKIISADNGENATIEAGAIKYLGNLSNAGEISIISPLYTTSAITCTRASNKPFNFYLTYLDYDQSVLENGDPVPPFSDPTFSAGEMFISLLLLIIILIGIMNLLWKSVSEISIFKKYTGVNQLEGKEEYKL